MKVPAGNLWFEISVSKIQGNYAQPCFIILRRDITKRKQNEIENQYLSFHDSLTGLYNRRFVDEEINRLDTPRQLPFSIIIGDMNGLKITNDTFGHIEGDKLIGKISEILKRTCRNEDIIARWGGDEFLILLPKTTTKIAEKIMRRITEECHKTNDQRIPLSIALGVATKTETIENINNIIDLAEGNMYKNKLGEKHSTASSIITALEQTLHETSHETLRHTLRIKRLSIEIGKTIGVPANIIDELSLVASLHDIGKVAIPEAIIEKKGKLTVDEMEIMKRHSEIGYNIAKSSPQIMHIANYILSIHERWDGTGYPNRLKGEDIPLVSRIISIADAYDVMRHKRSYKTVISEKESLLELQKNAGTQFDPQLVKIFIELMRNK
jgi:diguanylate cyclase (GGDEF)-like protein